MTTSIVELERQIEQLVRAHVAACQRAAAAAVERAFAAAPARAKTLRTGRAPSRARGVRRSAEEIAALGERLCEAVRAHPGETMTALAPHVGATARELERPMARLKRAGRIRSVGQRSRTRYFPMAA
jgi:acyl-CoA reductase-like NAD-dependent aldehyde dehydrogenase